MQDDCSRKMAMSGDYNDPLPVSFRAEVLAQVMPALEAGECCSLIGVSGMGKSNLAHFLTRSDVQSVYWKDGRTWVVVIDTHGLVFGEQTDEYAILEYIIHRLLMAVDASDLPAEFGSWVSNLHAGLVGQPSAQLALRYLERICARLCIEYGLRLVWVFDQFEDLWQRLPERFFLNLRYLRDQFKYRVVYLVMTRDRLERARSDAPAVEAFWELMTAHVYGLGMYSEADAVTMVERIARRPDVALDSALLAAISSLSGRHPGLLRALFWLLTAQPTIPTGPAQLLMQPTIAGECAKIWQTLTLAEQQLVSLLAADRPLQQPDHDALSDLRLKGLVQGQLPTLFSPLFAAYVQAQGTADLRGVVIDVQRRQVWIDGHLLADTLPRLEFTLLSHLAQHAGTICEREDLLRTLYKDKETYEVNDQRLDTILRRLRKALGEDERNTRYLVTHRGVGIMLTQGRVND